MKSSFGHDEKKNMHLNVFIFTSKCVIQYHSWSGWQFYMNLFVYVTNFILTKSNEI